MKTALTIALLVVLALAAFRFRDHLVLRDGVRLSRVDGDFGTIARSLRDYNMNAGAYPKQNPGARINTGKHGQPGMEDDLSSMDPAE